MANTLGTDNLKKAVKLVVDLAGQSIESFKDGVQLSDGLSFINELIEVPGVISAKAEIVAEAKDLTPEEIADIENYAVTELGVSTEKVHAIVSNAIGLVLSMVGLVVAFKTPAESAI